MVLCFFFLWAVPDIFRANNTVLFWYLVVVNLLLRTGYTILVIPCTALGFEMCTDYNGRTKLQGLRNVSAMAANFAGPGLAWMIFFQDKAGVRAVTVPSNFMKMGMAFGAAALFFVLYVFFTTFKYMEDSRDIKLTGNNFRGFLVDMKEIITDIYPRWVFAYMAVVMLGIALVSTLQMYFYEHFMHLSGTTKTIAHGGAMLCMGAGAILASKFTTHFDKKGAVYIGCFISISCNFILAALFLPGWLKPGQTITVAAFELPIAFITFVVFHTMYWFGNGIMVPVATSMIADISEIHELETGVNKDGAYAAVFSFAIKVAVAVGTLVSMGSLAMIGFVKGSGQTQSNEVLWRLCAVTLLIGPALALAAMALIRLYPVDKNFIEKMRAAEA